MTLPDLTTDAELAAYLGKSRQYVQDQCRASRWPYTRVGRSYRFTDADVDAILTGLSVKPKPTQEQAAAKSWGRKTRKSA